MKDILSVLMLGFMLYLIFKNFKLKRENKIYTASYEEIKIRFHAYIKNVEGGVKGLTDEERRAKIKELFPDGGRL